MLLGATTHHHSQPLARTPLPNAAVPRRRAEALSGRVINAASDPGEWAQFGRDR